MRKTLLLWAVSLASAASALGNVYVFKPDTTVTSANGTFSISFGERVTYEEQYVEGQGFVPVYGAPQTGMAPGSAYYSQFVDSVLRAFNTLENTFANTASRTIKVQCVFDVDAGRTQGASADPWWQDKNNQGTSLTFGDLNAAGVDPNTLARVNKVEYLWKYGMNDSGSAALYDVQITFRSASVFDASNGGSFGSFYVGADPSGYMAGQVDVETTTLHEMGHALGFHSGSTSTNGSKSAMDLVTESQPSSLPGGGTEWYFKGENTLEMTDGTGVRLMPGQNGYDPHTMSPDGLLMADGTQNPGTMRDFTDLELAMFEDMGWTLAPTQKVPEPATATLSLVALAGLLGRRRRR